MAIASAVEARTRREGRALVLIGAVCGLAWAASLRGFMAGAAGAESTFSWFGTFGIILPLGTLVGALLGRVEHVRRTGGRHRRWFTLVPLIFGVDPSALVIVLPAMAGGWVLAGRGSRRARWAAGVVAFLPVPTYVVLVYVVDDIHGLATPRGAWVTVLLFSLLAVFTLACSIPYRATTARRQPEPSPVHQGSAPA